jgi:hypothetical protein
MEFKLRRRFGHVCLPMYRLNWRHVSVNRHPGGVLVGHRLPTFAGGATFAGGGAQGKYLVAIAADDVG